MSKSDSKPIPVYKGEVVCPHCEKIWGFSTTDTTLLGGRRCCFECYMNGKDINAK